MAQENCNFETSNDTDHGLQDNVVKTDGINDDGCDLVSVVEEASDDTYARSVTQNEAAVNETETLKTADYMPNDDHSRYAYVGHFPMPRLDFLEF